MKNPLLWSIETHSILWYVYGFALDFSFKRISIPYNTMVWMFYAIRVFHTLLKQMVWRICWGDWGVDPHTPSSIYNVTYGSGEWILNKVSYFNICLPAGYITKWLRVYLGGVVGKPPHPLLLISIVTYGQGNLFW